MRTKILFKVVYNCNIDGWYDGVYIKWIEGNIICNENYCKCLEYNSNEMREDISIFNKYKVIEEQKIPDEIYCVIKKTYYPYNTQKFVVDITYDLDNVNISLNKFITKIDKFDKFDEYEYIIKKFILSNKDGLIYINNKKLK